MNWNLKAMLETQTKVNDKVSEKLKEQPKSIDYLLAMHVEVFEFINAVGTWKWWKHSHVPNKEKILDELADVMAFYFSYLLTLDSETLNEIEEITKEVYGTLEDKEVASILRYITQCINDGEQQVAPVLMVESVLIAAKTVGATWKEIEEAYYKKSEVNIKRQEQNY